MRINRILSNDITFLKTILKKQDKEPKEIKDSLTRQPIQDIFEASDVIDDDTKKEG